LPALREDYDFFSCEKLLRFLWRSYSTTTGDNSDEGFEVYVETHFMAEERQVGREALNKLILLLNSPKLSCYTPRPIENRYSK